MLLPVANQAKLPRTANSKAKEKAVPKTISASIRVGAIWRVVGRAVEGIGGRKSARNSMKMKGSMM